MHLDGKMIEQTDILGRLTALEIKSRQHEDEIVCLKSAMSDLIRRMQLVDKGKGMHLKCYYCKIIKVVLNLHISFS